MYLVLCHNQVGRTTCIVRDCSKTHSRWHFYSCHHISCISTSWHRQVTWSCGDNWALTLLTHLKNGTTHSSPHRDRWDSSALCECTNLETHGIDWPLTQETLRSARGDVGSKELGCIKDKKQEWLHDPNFWERVDKALDNMDQAYQRPRSRWVALAG